jgi:hypothetical protein
MSRKDVLGFLTHWQKRQEAQKTWPLRFLKPDRQRFVEDPEIGVDSNVGLDDVRHGEGEKPDSMGGDGDKEQRQSQTRRDAKGNTKPIHSGSRVDMHADGGMDLPLTPAKVKLPLQQRFLMALSGEKVFHTLLKLLDTVEVRVVEPISTAYILTNPLDRRANKCSRTPRTSLGTLGL